MDNLVDIGLNLMHSSFKKDRVEIIEEAKKPPYFLYGRQGVWQHRKEKTPMGTPHPYGAPLLKNFDEPISSPKSARQNPSIPLPSIHIIADLPSIVNPYFAK